MAVFVGGPLDGRNLTTDQINAVANVMPLPTGSLLVVPPLSECERIWSGELTKEYAAGPGGTYRRVALSGGGFEFQDTSGQQVAAPNPARSPEAGSWQIQFGQGWRDAMPPDVREAFATHDGHDKLAVFCVRGDRHLEGFLSSGDVMFYRQTPDNTRAVADAFQPMTAFLSYLGNAHVDVVSLIFLNLAPQTFTPNARPAPVRAEPASIEDGLRRFCQAVRESITGKGMWSGCEWAMLSCQRQG